ncbi:hypothetical protein G7Y89_g1832 [Cudoniella acicularis]|uniref:Uncharacterized protein n=1 Tax=Cudoniella acicularis TaxID=354080 RepID=A0A8H4RVK9_9HELO|nr:hypothetical protein G7Y89_g1832 [Cudoniella acicularis]
MPRADAAPVAEYQEWPFQGFRKRTKIGDDITYNLQTFSVPPARQDLLTKVPTHSRWLDDITKSITKTFETYGMRRARSEVRNLSGSTSTSPLMPPTIGGRAVLKAPRKANTGTLPIPPTQWLLVPTQS